MGALENLVRVHRWILDEKRQKLADLQRFVDRLNEDLERVEESLESEREAAAKSPEGALAYASFVAAAVQRRKKLRQSIANLEREMDAARDEVGEAFQELKKYETAHNNLEQREWAKRKRREQLALDELGVSIYRRNQAARREAGD